MTQPTAPTLATELRAKLRVHDEEPSTPPKPRAKQAPHDYKTLTLGKSPCLQTANRPQRTVEVRVTEDDLELRKTFHAKPVDRRIFAEPKKVAKNSILTVPTGPRLSTQERTRYNAYQRNHERQEEDYQKRAELRQAANQKSGKRGPTQAKTPKMKGLQRHFAYQKQFEKEKQLENEKMRKLRVFKAQPMRGMSSPPRFPTASGPELTEPQPFTMATDARHQLALDKLAQLKSVEEQRMKEQSTVKARLMPDLSKSFQVVRSQKHLTEISENVPRGSHSELQATKRRLFAEKEKTRRENKMRELQEAETGRKLREELELKAFRQKQLTFHATPVLGKTQYQIQPSEKELTVPHSPSFQHRS